MVTDRNRVGLRTTTVKLKYLWTTPRLDGQHQDVDRTFRGRINMNNSGESAMEKVRPWCGQPSDQGRLKNRTGLIQRSLLL